MNREQLVELIIGTTQSVLTEQGLEVEGALSADTQLFGQNGLLDSLALVALVIAVEQEIEAQFDVNVELADDKALSQKNSPYRTIGTLADYGLQQFQGKQAAAR
jgi:acyl carrier protein